MPEPSSTPLTQLSQQCAACLRSELHGACEPCRELLRRALGDGNDAAWDTIMLQLWPHILRWIYAALPDGSPATVETLGYRALWRFRSQYTQRADLATHFPSFPLLLDDLRRCTLAIVAKSLHSRFC